MKRSIDLTKIKKPKEILKGKALRRKINVEDDLMILDLMVKP